MTPRHRKSKPVQLWLIHVYIGGTGILVKGVHYFAPQMTVLFVAIRAQATLRHFLVWMSMVTSCDTLIIVIFIVNYDFYLWTKKTHNTLIVVNRFLRLMGDKTIPDSAEPRHPHDAWPLFQWPPERYVLATEMENAIFLTMIVTWYTPLPPGAHKCTKCLRANFNLG